MGHAIVVYSKLNEEYVEEVDASSIELLSLQAIFSTPESDPMYECFPIDNHQAELLGQQVDVNLNFEQYNYFLEYNT